MPRFCCRRAGTPHCAPAPPPTACLNRRSAVCRLPRFCATSPATCCCFLRLPTSLLLPATALTCRGSAARVPAWTPPAPPLSAPLPYRLGATALLPFLDTTAFASWICFGGYLLDLPRVLRLRPACAGLLYHPYTALTASATCLPYILASATAYNSCLPPPGRFLYLDAPLTTAPAAAWVCTALACRACCAAPPHRLDSPAFRRGYRVLQADTAALCRCCLLGACLCLCHCLLPGYTALPARAAFYAYLFCCRVFLHRYCCVSLLRLPATLGYLLPYACALRIPPAPHLRCLCWATFTAPAPAPLLRPPPAPFSRYLPRYTACLPALPLHHGLIHTTCLPLPLAAHLRRSTTAYTLLPLGCCVHACCAVLPILLPAAVSRHSALVLRTSCTTTCGTPTACCTAYAVPYATTLPAAVTWVPLGARITYVPFTITGPLHYAALCCSTCALPATAAAHHTWTHLLPHYTAIRHLGLTVSLTRSLYIYIPAFLSPLLTPLHCTVTTSYLFLLPPQVH